MCLLWWRTSLLLAYSNTYLIWLPSGFLNMRPALLSHREEREKYNILIKQNFHFQVVVQFLQFHQQSAKRFKKKKKDDCNYKRQLLWCSAAYLRCIWAAQLRNMYGPQAPSVQGNVHWQYKLAVCRTDPSSCVRGKNRLANELLCMEKIACMYLIYYLLVFLRHSIVTTPGKG